MQETVYDTNVPIYLQLIEKIQRMIVTGEWRAGERIPAVRELALPEFPELHLTISVGGVHGQGRVRDLILQADTALYEAKIKKDCVVVYEEDANEAE